MNLLILPLCSIIPLIKIPEFLWKTLTPLVILADLNISAQNAEYKLSDLRKACTQLKMGNCLYYQTAKNDPSRWSISTLSQVVKFHESFFQTPLNIKCSQVINESRNISKAPSLSIISFFVCLFVCLFFYNTFILMTVEKQIWKKNGAWSDPIGIPITYWKTSFPSLEKQLFSKPSSLCKGCLCKNNWRFFVLGDLFNIIFISRYIIPSLHWNENQLVQTTS